MVDKRIDTYPISLLPSQGVGSSPPPLNAGLEWRDNFMVRQRVAGVIALSAAAAPAALLPHISNLAAAVQVCVYKTLLISFFCGYEVFEDCMDRIVLFLVIWWRF